MGGVVVVRAERVLRSVLINSVIFGALFFSEQPATPTLEAPFLGLISLYFSFNVCLYGERELSHA